MPTGRATYIPAVPSQFFTNTGAVAAGYKLFSYYAGTTSDLFTYTDSAFTAANTNPIVLDSAGRATIFVDPQFTYKFILATPTSASPPVGADIIWTRDNVIPAKDTGEGIDIYGTAGAVIAEGNVVALDTTTGKWFLADPAIAGRSIDAPRLGMAMTAAAIDETLLVRLSGSVTPTGGAYVLGTTYYLSSTAGELATVAPTGEYHAVPFAFCFATGSLMFPTQATGRVGTRIALKTIGFAAGAGNTSLSCTDEELTSYAVPIPAGILDQPGAFLVVEGVCSVANSSAYKTLKLQIDTTGTLVTVFGTSGYGADNIVPFRVKIFRREQNTGAYNGISHIGAAAGGAPTAYLCNAGTSDCNWEAGQTLRVLVRCSLASTVNSIYLTDYVVYAVRSYQGERI